MLWPLYELCFVILCYVMLPLSTTSSTPSTVLISSWYVMLCYLMWGGVLLCYVMLFMWSVVMLYYVLLCYVMLCYVMLCYVTLYDVILRYVMLCYVMLPYTGTLPVVNSVHCWPYYSYRVIYGKNRHHYTPPSPHCYVERRLVYFCHMATLLGCVEHMLECSVV